MKLVIIAVVALVAVAVAAPQVGKAAEPVKILRSDFDQQPDGPYQLLVETDDGTSRQENGELKQVPGEDNKPVNVLVVRGTYSYVDPEGQQHSLTYFADETGFHAEGNDIPKAARR